MRSKRRATPYAALASMLLVVVTTIQCSGSTPAAPSSGTPVVSNVALGTEVVKAGGSTQAVVSLTAAAPAGGSSVTMSSSNPAVATVPTSVLVQAGSTSATIPVTGLSAGTAAITASLNGTTSRSPMLTVTAGEAVALRSISVSAASVVGGEFVTGTAVLSAAAPAGGAVVSLSGGDPIRVPASVTVPAESTSATFMVMTRLVGGTMPAEVTGSYGGASASATFVVTPPAVATARFGVSGETESDTCTLTNGGNTLDCTFNGSTSTAPGTIIAYEWSYGVAAKFTQTTSGPVLKMPTVNCGLVPPPPFPDGPPWFTMVVTLRIHDSLGNVSEEAVNRAVRLIPKNVCGF